MIGITRQKNSAFLVPGINPAEVRVEAKLAIGIDPRME
jgi:hypothetical protein